MSESASIHSAYSALTLQECLREMANDGSVRTHIESCWQWHLPCAAMYAADVIDGYVELLRSLEWAGELDSCPICHAMRGWQDHESDCQLGTL